MNLEELAHYKVKEGTPPQPSVPKPKLTRAERYQRIYARIILNTGADFKKDTERVAWLLKNYPGTRGDDRLLEFRYRWRYEGVPFPSDFFDMIEVDGELAPRFKTMVASETITRCRRKIQYNWGVRELLPSREVLMKRKIREVEIDALFRGEPIGYAKKF